jgi:NADH:ubiquinone oxidoreductase subunit 6 (subunit J)
MVYLFFIVLIFAIIQMIRVKKPLHTTLYLALAIFSSVAIWWVLLEMKKAF